MQQQEQFIGGNMHEREMDSLLERQLDEGEQLLWFGHSGRQASGSPFIALFILTAIFGFIGLLMVLLGIIFSIVLPPPANAIAGPILLMVGGTFLLASMIIGIIGASVRFSGTGNDQIYAITDQRILIIRKQRNLHVDSYTHDEIGPIRRTERPDGSGDLIFSGSFSPYASGYTGNTSTYNGTYNNWRTGRFNGVANVREVERVLRRTFKRLAL